MENLFENNGAEFSPCGKYRYKLWRIWDNDKPLAICIGLNPSTANADKNDATISLLKRVFSKLGYGGFYMLNLFTYITSKPKELFETENKEGSKWAEIISEVYHPNHTIVFAWGNFKGIDLHTEWVIANFDGYCFGKNSNGSPFHPRALVYKKGAQENPELIKY